MTWYPASWQQQCRSANDPGVNLERNHLAWFRGERAENCGERCLNSSNSWVWDPRGHARGITVKEVESE